MCFLGDVVWCVVVSVTDIVFVFFAGQKKMVQRTVEFVADYEDRVNLLIQVRASGYFFFNDLTLL